MRLSGETRLCDAVPRKRHGNACMSQDQTPKQRRQDIYKPEPNKRSGGQLRPASCGPPPGSGRPEGNKLKEQRLETAPRVGSSEEWKARGTVGQDGRELHGCGVGQGRGRGLLLGTWTPRASLKFWQIPRTRDTRYTVHGLDTGPAAFSEPKSHETAFLSFSTSGQYLQLWAPSGSQCSPSHHSLPQRNWGQRKKRFTHEESVLKQERYPGYF